MCFNFFTWLRGEERGNGESIFLFLLKKVQAPLAGRNILGFPFNGGVESEDFGISVIKRPSWAHREAGAHSLTLPRRYTGTQVRPEGGSSLLHIEMNV